MVGLAVFDEIERGADGGELGGAELAGKEAEPVEAGFDLIGGEDGEGMAAGGGGGLDADIGEEERAGEREVAGGDA